MTQYSNDAGARGEELAKGFLEKNGFEFVESNYWCKLGEIDLVMKQGETLVMVEVKMRAETIYGEGMDVVGWQKQKKLIRAAKHYQQEREYWGDVRFDVVAITTGENKDPAIEHVEYAFEC